MNNKRKIDEWNEMIQDDDKKIKHYGRNTLIGYVAAICGIIMVISNARREGGFIMHKEIATMMKEVDEKHNDN